MKKKVFKSKFWENKLDERQEETLLKIEHTACWVGFWGLFLLLILQGPFNISLGRVGGEALVFAVMSLIIVVGCISQGIWDRHISLGWKTNLVAALIAALVIGLIHVVANLSGRGFSLPWFAILILCLLTFVFTFLLMSLLSFLTKKRADQLEEEK